MGRAKLGCLHLVILSMNDPTAFWQYSGSLGLFSSRHGAGESGKDAAPTLSSMHRAASLSRVRFILVSIAFFWCRRVSIMGCDELVSCLAKMHAAKMQGRGVAGLQH